MHDPAATTSAGVPRALPWLVGAGAGVLYLLTAQRQLYNDGVFFEDMLRRSGEALVYNHVLYPPLVKCVELALSQVVPVGGPAKNLDQAILGAQEFSRNLLGAPADLRLMLGQSLFRTFLGSLLFCVVAPRWRLLAFDIRRQAHLMPQFQLVSL